MANVGNLFVNIGGNTKGLTKSLKAAKTKLLDFSSSAIKEQKKVVADAMENAAMAARGATVGARSGNLEMMTQSRIQAASSGRTYREERGKLTQMEAKRSMAISLGILGVSISAVSMLFGKAVSIAQETRKGIDQFRLLGPEGSKIIEAEIAKLLGQVKAAQDPSYSKSRAALARTEEAVQRSAIRTGQVEFLNDASRAAMVAGSEFGEVASQMYGGRGLAGTLEAVLFPIGPYIRAGIRATQNFGGY